MRKSIVYFVVVLTLLSIGLVSVPSVHSQTQNIKILTYSWYVDSTGFLEVVGEVQNVGPNTINPVILVGSVYSPDQTDLSDSYCQVYVAYLAPQQKAPFSMPFPPPSSSQDITGTGTGTQAWDPSQIGSVSLSVATANATTSYQYPDLTITSNSHTIGTSGDLRGAYLVNGKIENTGTQTATNLTVVASFYNSSGTVIAVGYTDWLTPASLDPSKTLNFQVAAFDLNETGASTANTVTSYYLLVQTQGPVLQGNTPIITPNPNSGSSSSSSTTNSPTAAPTNSPSEGTTSSPTTSSTPVNAGSHSNNASNTTTIYAIVIVVVIAAVAGAILALRKRAPPKTVKQVKKSKTIKEVKKAKKQVKR